MPHTICYLINMPGVEFNRQLIAGDQLPSTYFDQLQAGEADYREAHLEGNRTSIGIDLTGVWTEVGLAYPYSALLDELPAGNAVGIRERISEWEHHLRHRIPSTEILRLDEFLFSQWQVASGDSPIRNTRSMQHFLEWLETQDRRHWARLPIVAASAP